MNPAHGTICRHPCLNVLVCKVCVLLHSVYSVRFTSFDVVGCGHQCCAKTTVQSNLDYPDPNYPDLLIIWTCFSGPVFVMNINKI